MFVWLETSRSGNEPLQLQRLDDSRWWVQSRLGNGQYQYKFIVTDSEEMRHGLLTLEN